jgi:hypothetical protein
MIFGKQIMGSTTLSYLLFELFFISNNFKNSISNFLASSTGQFRMEQIVPG